VKHPSDVVKPEQEVDVIILKFDKEKQRVSLGMKQLIPILVGAAEKYPAGGKVKARSSGCGLRRVRGAGTGHRRLVTFPK